MVEKENISPLKGYHLVFHASGMNGSENYLVVAGNMDAAKQMWERYVKGSKVEYFWEKAVKGAQNHYGGYVSWKEADSEGRASGCYRLAYDPWNAASDHLND